jgi:UDP-N-acetylmuramyl tripeptide synthase
MSEKRLRRSARTTLAGALGEVAARASKLTGSGSGVAIAGRVMLAVQPRAVNELAADRNVVIITGTNGKTTTTRLIRVALEAHGPVASNDTGANMLNGIAIALNRNSARQVVLEVDEQYVPGVVEATQPKVVALTNLSRDQLDRVAEVAAVGATLGGAFARLPSDGAVVANADDPLVVKAALLAPHQVWVRAGQWWTADSTVCPWCGELLDRTDGVWSCACGRRRPETDWVVNDDHTLSTPDGRTLPIELQLPGRANRANAGLAAAAAHYLGVDPAVALRAMSSVQEVAGRNARYRLGNHVVRVLLAKNPAGWRELLNMVSDSEAPLVIAINSRAADSKDVSWLWDVDFENLAGRQVVAAGERCHDMAVRLNVAGLGGAGGVPVRERVEDAIKLLPAGDVYVVGSYTQFYDTSAWLRQKATPLDGAS